MREIKFRAWSQDTKSFRYFDLNKQTAWPPTGFYEPYQQYTGLKDKNGKEIYEGDLCRADDCRFLGESGTFVIGWDAEHLAFRAQANSIDSIGIYNTGKSDLIEVIGNIYENPELLKEVV